jgi:glutamate synthase domain-containing protein 1
MCGIVGLFAKSPEVEERLGKHLAAMLAQMNDRGPDSAGVAIYRDPAPAEAEAADAEAWVRANRPDLRVMSAGSVIEIYKETGLPRAFAEEFRLTDFRGTHALGHTRMATESRVTTEGSHPFSTGFDLCLVHNGSLSNHNRLRENLRREGIDFQTENDTEVAAGYLAWRMREGATLEQALEGCLEDLDGFYTFAVGTADGFAVLRDPIACKPAVLAETDDWVAMGSEWRAIAVLPGAADARMWEPQPGVVYVWEKVAA